MVRDVPRTTPSNEGTDIYKEILESLDDAIDAMEDHDAKYLSRNQLRNIEYYMNVHLKNALRRLG